MMWTLTFVAGGAAPGQLKCVSVCAQRLLLVAVQKLAQWAKAPLGSTQNVLSWLHPHDLTVLIVNHGFILKVKWWVDGSRENYAVYSLLHNVDDPTLTSYPHDKGHEVFVVVSRAAAKDVQALMVARATQLTNRKVHPVIKETQCVFVHACVWVWVHVWSACICWILTTQDRGSNSECTPGVLGEPPLYKGNDGHRPLVCNIHQLMIQTTEPLIEKETPVPLWTSTRTQESGEEKWTIQYLIWI